MKSTSLTVLIALASASTLAAQASGSRKSSSELLALADSLATETELVAPADERPKQSHPSKASILDTSITLTSGRDWTYLPKSAILALPEGYANRADKRQGNFKPFSEFIALNRSWIETVEISRQEARDADFLTEALKKRLNASGRVVITTHKGGAIGIDHTDMALELATTKENQK